MLQQQQQQQQRMPQQYSNGMMYGGPQGMPMMPQQQAQPAQSQTIGVRRRSAHMDATSGMHPDVPAGKRYRKVISDVSSLFPSCLKQQLTSVHHIKCSYVQSP